MKKCYRIVWEMAALSFVRDHIDYYENPTVPNSLIPDEFWGEVAAEGGEDQLDQYRQLKEWADADTQFVRNVRLYELTAEATEVLGSVLPASPVVPAGSDRFA
jgi:hypothetical protein